jgi:hypothetical protein
MTLRRRARDEIALPLDMLDFLLNVDRSAAEIDELRANGIEYDNFIAYDEWPDGRLDGLWKAHDSQLRAEAKRRGIPLPPWRR